MPFSLIVIGSNLELSSYSILSYFLIIKGSGSLKIGVRSFVAVGAFLDLHADITIGEYSGVGPKNVILTHGIFWPMAWGYKPKEAPVKIGNLVWIGANVKVLSGSTVKNEVLILPNSTITGTVKKSCAIYSNPIEKTFLPLTFFKLI